LALQFQITIIELKLSYEAERVASVLEEEFFRRFFGENQTIRDFVRKCLLQGRKDLAKELNKAIRLLGSPKTEAQAQSVISAAMNKINQEKTNYRPWSYARSEKSHSSEGGTEKNTEDEGTKRNAEANDSKWDAKKLSRIKRTAEAWSMPLDITAKALSLGIFSSIRQNERIFAIDGYSAEASLGIRGKRIFEKSRTTVLRDRDLYALVATIESLLTE
jgi:hypothetical protein